MAAVVVQCHGRPRPLAQARVFGFPRFVFAAAAHATSLMHIDAASKKRAARASLSDIEGGGFVTTGGPDSAYWYHQHSQWARTSAFKPWSPVLLKERMAAGKLPLGEQLLAGLPPLPVYLKHK
ncbi:hypothetical protein MTO96_007920 [Rhipicephalus appendiculatus]